MWGRSHDERHDPWDWLMILQRELGEISGAVLADLNEGVLLHCSVWAYWSEIKRWGLNLVFVLMATALWGWARIGTESRLSKAYSNR